jgi:DNA polymerase III sliding clamp (beta) subunit (PCNA family)
MATIKAEPNRVIEYAKDNLIPALDRAWRGAWLKDSTKPVLACVLFTAEKKRLTLVSTDGYKMLIVRTELDYAGSDFLLQADHVKRMAGDGKKPLLGSLEIDYIERRVKHNFIESATFYQMVDDGKFPDWKGLVKQWKSKKKNCIISFSPRFFNDLVAKEGPAKLTIAGQNDPIKIETGSELNYKSESYLMPVKINE